MPAIITHHLFGEDASSRLPEGLSFGQEELLAFLLGNQGPDPLYARFSARPSVVGKCNALADALHDGRVVEALTCAREAADHLPEEDQGIGRAFVLGFGGHYILDSTAHPFVYAMQNALVAHNPELEGLEDEVHALIEGDIDSWMLWHLRGLTVNEAPTPANLAHTRRVIRVSGAIVAQVAHEVYDIEIGPKTYGDSVSDYELIYALIDPASPRKTALVSRIERAVRNKSYLEALAHRVVRTDECPVANLACHRWRDPHTGKPSNDSFPDLYFTALDRWPAFARALYHGDAAMLTQLCGGINYNGVPEVTAR